MAENTIIRVVIVGDFLIFRNGLRSLLEAKDCFEVAAEAANLLEAATFQENADIFLIDSSEIDGGDFNHFVQSIGRSIPALVLTGTRHNGNPQKYIELGIGGIFSKENGASELFKAIEQVSKGDLWFERKLMVDTIQQLIKEKKALPEKIYSYNCSVLTAREIEVLRLICQGMKNKTIADRLFITETTVRHHLTSIFEKLKVNSRLELVVHAFNQKLVEVPVKEVKGFAATLRAEEIAI